MFLRTSIVLGTALAVATASLVLAQQPKGQGRGQRPGGPGGPGGFGTGVTSLLGTPEVQKELGVNDDQKGLIDDMLKDMRGSGGRSNFQDFRNLSQEERQKRFEEARKQGEERAKKAEEIPKVILEPKQFERLAELRIQREGVGALDRAEVAEKLGLTQEQKDKIRKIREESRSDRGGFDRNASREERDKAAAQSRERREKANGNILAVFTTQQKETWEKMQGKKFDFPQRQGGPSGGDQSRTRPPSKKAA